MNMKDYLFDYKSFFNHIKSQTREPGSLTKSLNALLDHLESQDKNSVLILHNFDLLRHTEGIDETYDCSFFQALNSISKRRHIALLSVSESAHTHYRVQADGSGVPGSHLDAIALALPPITIEQLKSELHRRQSQLTEMQLHEIASSLVSKTSPYSALEKLII